MGIDQAQQQLVVGVSREPVFVVEVAGDSLSIKAIEPNHFFTCCVVSGNGVGPSQRRDPLAEGAARGKALVETFAVVVIRIVVVPSTEILARRGYAGHL